MKMFQLLKMVQGHTHAKSSAHFLYDVSFEVELFVYSFAGDSAGLLTVH